MIRLLSRIFASNSPHPAPSIDRGLLIEAAAHAQKSSAFAAEGGDSFAPLQKVDAISYRASQQCSKRRPITEFEPGIVFGRKVETTIFFCF
jgi:hypothetical protein